jgi:hypothetical protein
MTRPSLRDSEIRAQSGMAPKEINVGELIVTVIAIVVVAILIWLL